MQPRRILFWAHLSAGVVAGMVVLIMCATGVALAFERQIIQIADRAARAPISSGSARLPLETLVSKLPHGVARRTQRKKDGVLAAAD
ncbi:MAG: PepSY domain-containing protein [Acidobacteriaceae bacterium]|nr:PepSY domain-containing protein [Acidobacteriaceae bacterium]